MKTIKVFLFFLFFSLLSAYAQEIPPPPGRPGGRGPENNMKRDERIKALYAAYITDELKFTEEEAQSFWPIHAQYDAEFRAMKFDMPELERQQAMLNIKKKYQDKFLKVLGNARTDEFFRKDEEFKKKMIEHLRKMREERMKGGGPGDEPPPPSKKNKRPPNGPNMPD